MLARSRSGHGKVLVLLCLLYIGFLLVAQLSVIADPSYLHEQQRTLFRYYRLHDPSLFRDNYITDFVSAVPQPFLYQWINRGWLWAGGDLIVLGRLLPIVSWLAFLAGVAMAARKLGDRITILGAVGLALAQPIYLHQIAGATPHGFGFPLLIWGIAALLYGSTRGLAALTLLSGLLYVAVAPILGLLLVWQVFVMQGFSQLAIRDRLKALLLLAAVGAVSLGLLYLSLRQPVGLGAQLEPMQRVDVFPENGPEGAYTYGVLYPLKYVLGMALTQFRMPSVMQALPVLLASVLVAAYGQLSLSKESTAGKALAGFLLCSLAVALAIYLLKPFHTYRFVLYPLFTALPLLVVTGLQGLCRSWKRFRGLSNAITVAVLGLLVFGMDSLNTVKFGYWVHLNPEERAVLNFAAAQPPDTLFAIWPRGGSAFDFIPYLARRPLLVMAKAHFPTHELHVLRMRERTYAVIDAYLATEAAPLQSLHCRWGVDYLIVDKSYFAPGGEQPTYFAPFDAHIEEIWRAHRRTDFLMQHPDQAAVALATENYSVVNLAALTGGADCPVRRASPGIAKAD